MTQKVVTLEANADRPCDCCKRVHRKLYLVDGYWMGQACADQYNLFRNWNDPNSLVWRGWEKQYAKVKAMISGVTS